MRAKEIDIIRTFVILALVGVHALAPWTGGWAPVSDGSSVMDSVYKWLGHFCYAGMLETFSAISGYVFYISESKRESSIKTLFTKKLRRLYVPALIWGVVYYLLFYNSYQISGIWRIVNGIGHLWYLPMLFLCFLIEKAFVIRYRISLLVLLVMAPLPYPGLPLQLNQTLYYLFFFHCGYLACKHNNRVYRHLRLKWLLPAIMIAAGLIVFLQLWLESLQLSLMPLVKKAFYIYLSHCIRLVYSVIIVAGYFYVGYKMRNTKYYKVFSFVAECSFGVYILQEIIIRLFYYKIECIQNILPYAPLAGFVVGGLVSLLIVVISKRLRIANAIF